MIESPRVTDAVTTLWCGFGRGGLAVQRTDPDAPFLRHNSALGTPAEETLVGKTYMARDGLFDDLDGRSGMASKRQERGGEHRQPVRIIISRSSSFGRASHAAVDPWNGRSALDAVELMAHG